MLPTWRTAARVPLELDELRLRRSPVSSTCSRRRIALDLRLAEDLGERGARTEALDAEPDLDTNLLPGALANVTWPRSWIADSSVDCHARTWGGPPVDGRDSGPSSAAAAATVSPSRAVSNWSRLLSITSAWRATSPSSSVRRSPRSRIASSSAARSSRTYELSVARAYVLLVVRGAVDVAVGLRLAELDVELRNCRRAASDDGDGLL